MFSAISLMACDSTVDPKMNEGTSFSGRIANLPDGGLPDGTRALILWEARRPSMGDVLVVGNSLSLNRATGDYSLSLSKPLSDQLIYAGIGGDTLGVGYIIVTTATSLQEFQIIDQLEHLQDSIIGALDSHAVVYKRGTQTGTFANFKQGFSLAVTIPRKPVEKEGLEPN
jgi:hypothetical protein